MMEELGTTVGMKRRILLKYMKKMEDTFNMKTMTNEQVALQEAVKYVTTYYSTKFAIDRDKETDIILEIADTFNKQLYNMRAEYEVAASRHDKGPN